MHVKLEESGGRIKLDAVLADSFFWHHEQKILDNSPENEADHNCCCALYQKRGLNGMA